MTFRRLPALALGLLCAAPAFADRITVKDRGSFDGKIVEEKGGVVVADAKGWRVRLRAKDVVAVERSTGWVRLPAADRAEDRGLLLETRGDYAKALEAYAEATHHVLVAARAGALKRDVLAARVNVFLRRVHFFALSTGAHRRAVEITTHVLDEPALTPLARDIARNYRARHLRSMGRPRAALQDERDLGLVSAFFVVGSFDNERGTGFEQAYGPETDAFTPDASYEGKKHTVSWRPQPVAAPPRGQIDMDELLRPDDQALGYAVTYLHAERDTPVALRLGSDEALKVWVNRNPVLSRKLRRPYRDDQDHVGVVLKKGWNQVLLKVCDQTGAWLFRLRVTAPAGGPARGVRAATLDEIAKAPAFAEGKVAKAEVDQGGIPALTTWTQTYTRDWRSIFHLGYLQFGLQAHDRTLHPDRDAFEAAIALRPKHPALQVFLSHASGGSGEFSVNREDNARRAALEKAIELDPSCHKARYMLAQYYADDLGNDEKARAILAPTIKEAPGYMAARMLQLSLDSQRGLDALARAELKKLFNEAEEAIQTERAETFPEAILLRVGSHARIDGDVRRQMMAYELLLETDRSNASWMARLAELHASAGRFHRAEDLYRRAIQAWPFSVSLRRSLALIHERAGRLDDAAAVLRATLELAPEHEEVVESLGRIEEARGKTELANSLFAQALELNPNLVDLKKYLEYRARNEEKQAPFEDAWAVDPAPVVAKVKGTPLDPRRTHRILFRQEVARVNRDGTKSEFIQEIVRVENRIGARQLTRYPVVYGSEQHLEFQRAQVFRQDGSVEEAPVGSTRGRRSGEFSSSRQFSVRFPPLEPGDAFAVRYRVDDLEEGFFGDYYGKTAFFQRSVALDHMRYVLVAPKGRRLHFHTPGMQDVPHQKTEQGESIVHVFEKKGVPPLESEANMPWAKEVLPQVQVSTFKDWDEFSTWYWGLVESQHEADPAIKAKVKELTKDCKTDADKIRRIYNYVVTDIRYNASWEFGIHGFKPYNATKIFARKFGDCKDKATLIGTMLKEVGIKAHPVLIFGEDRRGKEDLTLPLMNHFNHCISWVDHGGEQGLFLDGTAQYHPYATLPTMDYGAKVVVITPKKGVVREIPYRGPDDNAVSERHVLKVERTGKATLSTTINGSGTYGVVLREVLETEGRRKDVLEPRIGSTFGGARVTDVKTSDLSNLDTPVKVDITVEVPNVLRPTSDGRFELREVRSWLFDLIYLGGNKVSSLAADSEREQDVILSVPSGVVEDVTYELPPDVRVESVPKSVTIDQPFGTYELKYEQDGPRLRVRRVFKIKVNRILKDEYEAFRKFVRDIEQAESERPVLGKGGAE